MSDYDEAENPIAAELHTANLIAYLSAAKGHITGEEAKDLRTQIRARLNRGEFSEPHNS